MQKPKAAKVKGYIMIFNKDNMPRIDDPTTVPDQAWQLLTQEQKDYANAQVMEHKRRFD